MTTTTQSSPSRVSPSYFRLVRKFPLVSVKNEGQLSAAQRMIDSLLAEGKLDRGETLYLEALTDLVAAYEDAHHPIPPATDAQMLRHLLEAKGMTPAELHAKTGISKEVIADLMAEKKTLSRNLIRTLARCFNVHPSVLESNL